MHREVRVRLELKVELEARGLKVQPEVPGLQVPLARREARDLLELQGVQERVDHRGLQDHLEG